MSTLCRATKADGSPCTLPANGPQGVCWAHDPRNAERRRRTASKGGKGRANSVTKELHALLQNLTDRVVAGTLVPYRGAVAAQLVNTRIRLIEADRRLREEEEIIERLERVERTRRPGVWGA